MDNTTENKQTKDIVQEEISTLRNNFKDNIRILSSIGQFSYILKIRADQYDISLTLQLDQSYPAKAPEVIITAPRLSPEQILLVQQHLQSYSETLLNQPMILLIYASLLHWFAEHNIQTIESSSSTSSNINNNNNTSSIPVLPRSRSNSKAFLPSLLVSHSNKTSQADEQEGDLAKKSSMKTAEDVISRIEWDRQLDKRRFRVGYVDRFIGLQEKPFIDFDFKVDLSTISDKHSNVLAIPKHRIQYFKYDNEIIWDKETRTDLMFGSTGNEQSIYDVIKRHKNDTDNSYISSTPDKETSEDENDTTMHPRRYLTLTDESYKPNYFLSIPITDSTLIMQYDAFREHLVSTYPLYFSIRENSPHLHMTLLTFHIGTTAQIESIGSAFKRLQEELRYHCSYPEYIALEFNGIDTFHDKLIYVKCQPNQRLKNLRNLIVKRLSEEQEKQNLTDIYFAGNYFDYCPHITLLKCKRKFSSVCPHEGRDITFGKQLVNCLQLCPIGKTDNENQNKNFVYEFNLV